MFLKKIYSYKILFFLFLNKCLYPNDLKNGQA